jgi:hypothetical protein
MLFEFEVAGRGQFPIDMLRYDQCWPKRESEDAMGIERSFRNDPGILRQVTLRGLHPPTVGRWESFGWKIIDERKVR